MLRLIVIHGETFGYLLSVPLQRPTYQPGASIGTTPDGGLRLVELLLGLTRSGCEHQAHSPGSFGLTPIRIYSQLSPLLRFVGVH